MADELYLKYRPMKFSDVIGQDAAIRVLKDMGKRGVIPHVILFHGPSGCGKTTLARILRLKLKCSDMDFQELNFADMRGIAEVRLIRSQVGAAPLSGPCRIWLIDECHAMTADAQNAFLKLLEDTPKHVYFFLATTDPGKLKTTIRTRCTEIKCSQLSDANIRKLIASVVSKEGADDLESEVVDRIVEVAEGSARKSLVILHSILGLPSVEAQLAGIESGDSKGQAIEIARRLLDSRTTWPDMASLLKSVDDEPETLRWMVLGYCKSVLLGRGNHVRAARIIEEFRDNWYDSKHAGLVVSCYNVISE